MHTRSVIQIQRTLYVELLASFVAQFAHNCGKIFVQIRYDVLLSVRGLNTKLDEIVRERFHNINYTYVYASTELGIIIDYLFVIHPEGISNTKKKIMCLATL